SGTGFRLFIHQLPYFRTFCRRSCSAEHIRQNYYANGQNQRTSGPCGDKKSAVLLYGLRIIIRFTHFINVNKVFYRLITLNYNRIDFLYSILMEVIFMNHNIESMKPSASMVLMAKAK